MKNFLPALFMSAIFAVFSCKKTESEKEETEVFPITTPLKLDTVINKEYVAQIRSQKNIEIRSQERGLLQKIYVDEGQYVRAGQPLFRIMPQILEAEVMKAKAEVDQARIELQNSSILASHDIVSKNEKAMAQAKLQSAEAELRLAQTKLGFTTIKAPFSGIIDRLPKKLGSLVDEGELLTTLSDNSGLYAYFNLAEPDYLNYQLHAAQRGGSTVELLLANGEKFSEKGQIETIEGEFDSESGNIAFRAKFPNANGLLRNGETGKILMPVELHDVLAIPQKATYEIQDKKYVFVLDKNGHAKSREITVSHELPDLYLISGGLQPTDKFLVEGVQKIKDNQAVKTKYVAPSDVMKSLQLDAN